MPISVSDGLSWRHSLDLKVHAILMEIANLKQWSDKHSKSKESFELHASRYYKTLNEIYFDEFPLAKILDTSDLIVRYESDRLELDNPSVTLMSGVFENVQREVTSVTKAVAGLGSETHIPKEMDLRLNALARGSLILGFSVPPQIEHETLGSNLLGDEDPLYAAVRLAIKTLGIVSKKIGEGASSEDISSVVSDPKLRDTAISAVHKLAPSPQSKISRVGIIDNKSDDKSFPSLTPQVKRDLAKALRHPIRSSEIAGYRGMIREMDLDARRFELRFIEGSDITDLRCIYSKDDESIMKNLLGATIDVRGRVERLDGKPRLLEMDGHKIVRLAKGTDSSEMGIQSEMV